MEAAGPWFAAASTHHQMQPGATASHDPLQPIHAVILDEWLQHRHDALPVGCRRVGDRHPPLLCCLAHHQRRSTDGAGAEPGCASQAPHVPRRDAACDERERRELEEQQRHEEPAAVAHEMRSAGAAAAAPLNRGWEGKQRNY